MTSGGSTRRRPRPWLCPASVCVVGTLLQLREAASLVSPCTCTGAAAARRVSSSSTSSSWLSSCTLQHGSTGPLLAERIRVRRRSRCTGVGRLLRCSGLTAVEEGPAAPGSDEAGAAVPSSSAGAVATALASGGVEYCAKATAPPAAAAAAATRRGAGPGALSQQQQQREGGVSLFENGGIAKAIEGGDSSSRSSSSSDSDTRSLYTMMGLCFLVAVVCALDRVAMSVAIVPMGNVYGYTDTTKGLISSVFSWGYMASMIPSSVLIGVWGPKATMATGALVWSAAQMLSPAAAGVSLETLLACRFLMGLGEAVLMPSIQAIVSERVPQDQRSGWLALIISGLQIGTVLAYLVSPVIVDTWDWQSMFVTYGALGLAWAALWLPLVSDRNPNPAAELASTEAVEVAGPVSAAAAPAAAPAAAAAGGQITSGLGRATADKDVPTAIEASAGARAAAIDGGSSNGNGSNSSSSGLILPWMETVAFEERSSEDGEQRATTSGGPLSAASVSLSAREGAARGGEEGGVWEGFLAVPWKEYATNGQIWTIAAAHMSHNWGLYVLLAWLPTYYVQVFNLSLEQSSGASVAPWVAGAIIANMAGLSSDFLVKKGVLDVKSVRKLFQTVASVGPAMCMFALAQGPETSAEASLLFTAAVALGSCSSAGFSSSIQDLRSKNTGVIYGMTSACSAVVGSIGTYLAGVILDTTHSWTMVFQSTGAVYLVGACVYVAFYKAEPLAVEDRSSLL